MLKDLAKYDLIKLSLAETWPEKKQADMTLRYANVFAGYLNQRLASQIDESFDQKFNELIKKQDLTSDDVVKFYKENIPNYEETIGKIALDFKKTFLLGIYKKKADSIKSEVENLEKAYSKTNDEIQLNLLQLRQSELSDWTKVLLFAEQDNWDEVYKTLQKISH